MNVPDFEAYGIERAFTVLTQHIGNVATHDNPAYAQTLLNALDRIRAAKDMRQQVWRLEVELGGERAANETLTGEVEKLRAENERLRLRIDYLHEAIAT